MIKPEQIPDEVINELWGKGFDFVSGVRMPTNAKIKVMRQCIALAINAWPDAEKEHSGVCCNSKGSIILPMPQEKNDG